MKKSISDDPFSIAERYGIRFRIEDGRLKISADTAPPPNVVDFLRAHRDIIVARLTDYETCLICGVPKPVDDEGWVSAIQCRQVERVTGYLCGAQGCYRAFNREG